MKAARSSARALTRRDILGTVKCFRSVDGEYLRRPRHSYDYAELSDR